MNNTLASSDSKSMSSQSQILGLLKGLRLNECESRVTNGGNNRVVRERPGLKRDVKDNRVVGQFV